MSNVVRRIITSPNVIKPIAPYSQGVLVNNTLYISGQLGVDLNGQLVRGGAVPEAKQALDNLGHILKEAGSDFSKVVKTTVLLADINDFESVNEIYKKYFQERLPARAAFQVGHLPKGSLVEIEAIAIVGNITEAN